MYRIRIPLFILILLATWGCGPDDPELSRWQQQQVTSAQQLARGHSAAAETLVKADARAREDLVRLERDLQAERTLVGRQRDALELERKALAAERRRAPALEALFRWLGIAILCALPLVICLQLLGGRGLARGSSELEEILIFNLAAASGPLAPERLLPAPDGEQSGREGPAPLAENQSLVTTTQTHGEPCVSHRHDQD